MYGKIFNSIYDGTLVEDWRALITFQQFIVLSDADGIVDMTPHAISRRTGIPIEHIKAGIEILEKEDKYSRTPEQKGRRIELIDGHRPWGWHIVNHEMYKKMATREEKKMADRIRIAKSREDKKNSETKGVASCSEVSQVVESVADVAHTDTDTDTDTRSKHFGNNSVELPPRSPCPYQKIIKLYHDILPTLPAVLKLTTTRRSHLQARWREMPNLKLFKQFFEKVNESKFLTGRVSPSDPNRKPFKADLSWLMMPENFAKVLEDKYS